MSAPPKLRQISVGRAVDEYMDQVRRQEALSRLAATTARNYARDLADFVALAGAETVLDDLTGPDIDDLLLAWKETPDRRFKDPTKKAGRSVGATNRLRQSVSRFFAYATKHGWVQANPMLWSDGLGKDRAPLRTERTALSQASALGLLAAAAKPRAAGDARGRAARADQDTTLRDRLLITLLVLLGPRVSEVCKANLDDITPTGNGDGAAVWRITGKGGKTRKVPIPAAVYDLYATYRDTLRPRLLERAGVEHRDDSHRAVFLTWRGRRMTDAAVRDVLNRTTAKVDDGLGRRATPHALRHTTATVLLAAGWDVKIVARLLGHSSIGTTDRYLDEVEGELGHAVAHSPLAVALHQP